MCNDQGKEEIPAIKKPLLTNLEYKKMNKPRLSVGVYFLTDSEDPCHYISFNASGK
jgi:hypothetical protein